MVGGLLSYLVPLPEVLKEGDKACRVFGGMPHQVQSFFVAPTEDF